ncbi:MAG: hypothetical protein RBU45_26780, partial [Myxococcota bacterium]|nr:hypothetical protein [Myxococcota bacterium]
MVRPEEFAPAEGCPVPESRLAEEFGLTEAPTSSWSRVDGGLFFLIDAPGLLLTPDRLRVPGLDRRPGETAFVLTRLP